MDEYLSIKFSCRKRRRNGDNMNQNKNDKKVSITAKVLAGAMAALMIFGSVALALIYILG